ncbi:hypothetical protein Ade02nite_34190 [Paractinoplanes deccanensis]|uniref:Uncharacterized protein n=1 Tax=Paractinoplanes deccanensis TaxID=113561 RepID=A0ABQ3Y475_9ACTN|nr:hypothetical protein [Actinoplanes deccanensis]GID74778.1 hypothetical protein Ade02nite_34190 [Actinoplanes deccanensis]
MSHISDFDDGSGKSELDLLVEAILEALRTGVLGDQALGIRRPVPTVVFEPGSPPPRSLLN